MTRSYRNLFGSIKNSFEHLMNFLRLMSFWGFLRELITIPFSPFSRSFIFTIEIRSAHLIVSRCTPIYALFVHGLDTFYYIVICSFVILVISWEYHVFGRIVQFLRRKWRNLRTMKKNTSTRSSTRENTMIWSFSEDRRSGSEDRRPSILLC